MSAEVLNFLLKFKQAASSNGIDLVPRAGMRETLTFLGLTKRNLEEILLGLSVTDYCKGPIPDIGRPGELWEFGKDYDRYQVYIKLKAAEVEGVSIAKCISFHIAKYPLKYPFKGTPQE